MSDIKELLIDRSKWFRGRRGTDSRLVRLFDKKMCCLGFLGIACGVPIEKMIDVSDPTGADDQAWPPWLTSKLIYRLVSVNDSRDIDEAQREAEIGRLFGAHGDVSVRFIDGEPK